MFLTHMLFYRQREPVRAAPSPFKTDIPGPAFTRMYCVLLPINDATLELSEEIGI